MRLEDLHRDHFAEYLHSDFQVMDDPSGSFDLKLVEVNDRTKSPRQEVFALHFHGPSRHFMQQGIHRLKHSQLGEIDLFLVPVGQDLEGFQYEAVFNRLISPKKQEV